MFLYIYIQPANFSGFAFWARPSKEKEKENAEIERPVLIPSCTIATKKCTTLLICKLPGAGGATAGPSADEEAAAVQAAIAAYRDKHEPKHNYNR